MSERRTLPPAASPTDRAAAIVEQFQDDGHPYYDELLEPIEAAITAAVAWERERIRGYEVMPLVRTLAEVGDLAEQALSERRWVHRVSVIRLEVRGCEILWPDLFDRAKAERA